MKAAAVAAKLEIPVTDSLKKILSWLLSVWLQYDDFLFLSALAEEMLSLTAILVAMVVVQLITTRRSWVQFLLPPNFHLS